MGIGVDKLFGGASCSLRTIKHKGFWYVLYKQVSGPEQRRTKKYKRRPTKKQLAAIRRDVCG